MSRLPPALFCWVLVAAGVSGCSSDSPTQPPLPNQVRLVDVAGARWTVEIQDPEALARARRMTGTGEQRWFFGRIRSGHGGHNAPWSWHIDPATVEVEDSTIEACQATVAYTEEHLADWLDYGTVCILSRVLG